MALKLDVHHGVGQCVNDKAADSEMRWRAMRLSSMVVTGGIVIAALILFVSNGSRALSMALSTLSGLTVGPNETISIALILNVALILLGWRRYRDLERELQVRTEAQKEAQHLARLDPLTGLLNRRAIAEDGDTLLHRAAGAGKPIAVMMLDLDHFKNVNDVQGHAAGDALLRAVAREVSALLPSSAIVGRLGGDEFACALPYPLGDRHGVDLIASAIIRRLSEPFDANGNFAHISASLGIATPDDDCRTMDALMRRADIAMYAAKHQGRNRYAWFNVAMEHELQARNAIEQGMRVGIPRGEFIPYFEQQIDLSTNRLHGFEVLARWEHPTRGLVMPDNFISIAEDSGAIADLSFAVMRQAFMEARHWDSSISLSVNISPTQLKDPWLAQKLVKLLTETGFPAGRLEVEITETSLFDNLALAQTIVGNLKQQGMRIALDDFGTGYSSLAHLRALPFDRIKIDKSFVTTVCDNAESAAIVSAITRLGHSLGLPITAEGIEDAAIEEKLRQLGCHKGQGFLYGRPMPAATARNLLAGRNLLQMPAATAALASPAMDWRQTG